MAEEKKKTLAEEAKNLIGKFDQEQKDVSLKVKELASFMADTTKLANNKHEIYRYRQELVAKKLDHMTVSNNWNRKAVKTKSDIYIAYKIGKRQIAPNASIAENHQLKPKNDFERGLYLDSDMSAMNYILQLIENQLEFIKDSLSNVTNMCFGMEHIIKLQEFISK